MTDPITEVHHFAYGWFHAAMAFSLAFLGSTLGLGCAARARAGSAGRQRAQWLVLAAISIGGSGIWLMHFMAMLGFDVSPGPVRYDPWLTGISMLIAVGTVGAGLFVVSAAKVSIPRLLTGGLFTGFGVAAMHYTGMAAVRLPGRLTYDPNLVAASVLIAVAASTVALWFTVSLHRDGHIVAGALLMAVAISGMHYTGMAAVRVELDPARAVTGVSSVLLLVPIVLITAGVLLTASMVALRAVTIEEFESPRP